LGKISTLKQRVVELMSSLDLEGIDGKDDAEKFVGLVEGFADVDGAAVGNEEVRLRELVAGATPLDVVVPVQLTFEPPRKSKVGRKKKAAGVPGGVDGDKKM
jgi:hypothetical protein